MNKMAKKSIWMTLLFTGIFFLLFAASTVFADYSGHVASFKNESNASGFVSKMKDKGYEAFYNKEKVKGEGEFYRTYVGRYKTQAIALKELIKLKKAGEIDYFKITKTPDQDVKTVKEVKEVKEELPPAAASKPVSSSETPNYYEGIKGIVLKNGKVIKGQILSIDDNDVLKIRTKKGKILSYSFVKDVKEYIIDENKGRE